MSSPQRRLAFLDAIRGVAALAVVVWHLTEFEYPAAARFGGSWFNLGRFGVCAFFLVSGFVIPMSLEREGSLRTFGIRRVLRLYPLYWFSLVAALLLSTHYDGMLGAAFSHRLPASAFVNVTMFQEYFGVPHAIFIYYTLSIELAWYVGCAALFRLGWLQRTEAIVWTGIAAITAGCVVAPLVIDHRIPFSTPYYGVVLLMGFALARVYDGSLPLERFVRLTIAAVALAIAGNWVAQSHFHGSTAEGVLTFRSGLFPWLLAYAVVLGAYAARNAPWPAVFTYLGRISYSVYLLHALVFILLIHWTSNRLVSVSGTVLLTVLVSDVAWRVIEAPAQSLARRLTA